MKYCINCGEKLDDGTELCISCGANQKSDVEGEHKERGKGEKYCHSCGELLRKNADACSRCGSQQTVSGSTSQSDGSGQTIAGILAIFLGGFGIHKFYQGNMKIGMLYLLFCWTVVPAVIGLGEGILILLADSNEYEREYADGSIFGM